MTDSFYLDNQNGDDTMQSKGRMEAAIPGGIPTVGHLIGKAIDKAG